MSSDASLRWAAAVELGEIPEKWAVELLWELRDDADQYVRAVAQKALSTFDSALVESAVFHVIGDLESSGSGSLATAGDSDLLPHMAWKTRPLEPPSEENDWAVSAAIIDIVNTEGPLTGSRLLRLYGESVFPNSPKKLSKFRMQRAVERLVARRVVSEVGGRTNDKVENWILFRTGTPSAVPRVRGSRKLSEIPVNEVAELVKLKSRSSRGPVNRNRQFQIIIDSYQIPQSELHLVGAVLDEEWKALLG
jgi:hypothetical protein